MKILQNRCRCSERGKTEIAKGQSDCYLIQHCNPESELLKTAAPYHRAYCERYKINYVLSTEETNRFALIRQTMDSAPYGALIIWLDHDAIICNQDIDLRTAIDCEYDLGAVADRRGGLFNLGVLFIHSLHRTRDLLPRLEAIGPKALQDWRGKIKTLDPVWNSYPFAKEGRSFNPVIKAWHSDRDTTEALSEIKRIAGV